MFMGINPTSYLGPEILCEYPFKFPRTPLNDYMSTIRCRENLQTSWHAATDVSKVASFLDFIKCYHIHNLLVFSRGVTLKHE